MLLLLFRGFGDLFLMLLLAFSGDLAALSFVLPPLRLRTFETACIRRMRSSSALMGSALLKLSSRDIKSPEHSSSDILSGDGERRQTAHPPAPEDSFLATWHRPRLIPLNTT